MKVLSCFIVLLLAGILSADNSEYRNVLKSALEVQPPYVNMKIDEDENGGTNYVIEIKTKLPEKTEKAPVPKKRIAKLAAEAADEKYELTTSLLELNDKLDKKTISAINHNKNSILKDNDLFLIKDDNKLEEAIESSEKFLEKLERHVNLL